jgi:hypothetical protein
VSGNDDSKSPLEHVMDAFVYAPLGFALEARSLLPKFVDRGRNQVLLARVVGKYAVRKGTRATESRITQAQDQVLGVLRLVGVAPGDETPSSNGHGTSRSTRTAEAVVETSVGRPQSSIDPETLAIPDYDALSASQVVPRLESLTKDELESVRTYESETRGRKTILNKIAQLQAS